MKNKMKDFEAKSKKWWEVVEEYSTKELEKKLAQHRVDEKITRYKLEAYQNNFLNFICGNPTSIEVSNQDEETEVGLNGTIEEEELQPELPQDLKGGGQEEIKSKGIQKQEKVEAIIAPREKKSNI